MNPLHKINHISCVIIVKNAASTIKQVLDALQGFDDIVLYDNGSIDTTQAIAKDYNNVNLVLGEFYGFGPTKNKAASYAKHDWIFSLDADEVVSSEFIEQLQALTLQKKHVYSILRENYYKKTQIKHCWGNDVLTRLYHKDDTSFSDQHVHERVLSEGLNTLPIKGAIQHYPYTTVTDFIIKLDRYSTLFAREHVGKKTSSSLVAFLNGIFSFLKTYILKRGFLDGQAGLIIAFSHMATNFYKYIKLDELNQAQQHKDP